MNEKHPFAPFIPPNATKLIVGTIPPHRFCENKPKRNLKVDDVDFYYGSCDNEFWNLIGSVYNINFIRENSEQSIKQRTDFLKENMIGITDIIELCYRENKSASDDKLGIIHYKDIRSLLLSAPSVDTLLYTSQFVKRCMNCTLGTYHSIDKDDHHKQYVTINNKKYTSWILFSPSPKALMGIGKDGTVVRKKQYEMIFKQFQK